MYHVSCYSETLFTDWDSYQRNFVLSILNPFSSLKTTYNEEHIWLSELAQKILQSLQFSSSWRGFSLLWNLCDKWGFGLAYEENTWFTLSLPCLTIFQQNITPFSKNIHYRCILPCTFLPTEFLQWFFSRLSCFNFVSLYLGCKIGTTSRINPP